MIGLNQCEYCGCEKKCNWIDDYFIFECNCNCMKDLNEFIKGFATLELNEIEKKYVHHPYKIFVEDKMGEKSIGLVDVAEVRQVYLLGKFHIEKGAKRVYFTVDFSANMDIKNDFIAVFSYTDKKLSIIALPYNNITGHKRSIIYESVMLNIIKSNCKKITGIKENYGQ